MQPHNMRYSHALQTQLFWTRAIWLH